LHGKGELVEVKFKLPFLAREEKIKVYKVQEIQQALNFLKMEMRSTEVDQTQ
jgi:hypothetical protein